MTHQKPRSAYPSKDAWLADLDHTHCTQDRQGNCYNVHCVHCGACLGGGSVRCRCDGATAAWEEADCRRADAPTLVPTDPETACSCPPGDCHGGHTINVGPSWVSVPDERLRQLRDDDIVCVQDWVRSMAAELLPLRARVAELENEVREHERFVRYLHYAHGIDDVAEQTDFEQWKEDFCA